MRRVLGASKGAREPSSKVIQSPRARYLLAHGWGVANTRSPWRWWKPPFKGVFYLVGDAISLERSRRK